MHNRKQLSFAQQCHVGLLHVLPHHLISRLFFFCTRRRLPGTRQIIRWFVTAFGVDMSEAMNEDISAYPTFNEFFTRPLKPGLRAVEPAGGPLTSPADGAISALGDIDADTLIQAKGLNYQASALLGGGEFADTFANGSFATIYLSPRDYHRVHMPCGGRLSDMVYVPGRLFSVAPHTVVAVPRLFARNERVASVFETPQGRVAVVLVGAINVAAIETIWHGLVTPPHGNEVHRWRYDESNAVALAAGEEMGRFNMGSTVIVLTEQRVRWRDEFEPGTPLRLGQAMCRPD